MFKPNDMKYERFTASIRSIYLELKIYDNVLSILSGLYLMCLIAQTCSRLKHVQTLLLDMYPENGCHLCSSWFTWHTRRISSHD